MLDSWISLVCDLTSEHLSLFGSSQLEGNLVELMAAHTQLEHLDVSRTLLEGTIPSESAMTDLRFFQVSGADYVSGTIPTEIGLWTSLGKIIQWIYALVVLCKS